MKLIAQLLAILSISANSLQLLLTIGILIVMTKTLSDKLKVTKNKWVIRQRRRSLDNDMWAIE